MSTASFLTPRSASQFFAIKRALAPIALGSKRYTERTDKDRYSAIDFVEKTFVNLWASSSVNEQVNTSLVVEGYGLRSGRKLLSSKKGVSIRSHCSTELTKVDVTDTGGKGEEDIVVSATLLDEDGNVLSRTFSWPEP